MMKPTSPFFFWCVLGLLASPAGFTQPYSKSGQTEATPKGPMPFMAAMKRHNMLLKVVKKNEAGLLVPVAEGTPVGVRVYRGGGSPKDYTATTTADGSATVVGVPSNPMIQRMLKYEAFVDHGGVRYPFQLDGIPSDGAEIQLTVTQVVAGDLSQVSAAHEIEISADEDSVIARHIIRLTNEGQSTVNLGALPGGGLVLPCPTGAKHPEMHEQAKNRAEVRGTSIVFRGALLPGAQGAQSVSMAYTIPYKAEKFEWVQTLPVRTTSTTVAAPQFKQSRQRAAVPMSLTTRQGQGTTDIITERNGRQWAVLRAGSINLAANEPLRFAIGGLPVPSKLPYQILVAAVVLVILIVVFGFRRQPEEQGLVLSLSHLETERDRLVKVLARMRKAHEKGRMPTPRFEREQEAITARLVSLYRAIDRLKVS
ncbi:MAG: hypothetical protein VYA30_04040 [Myxococcota bacterium]|nr:hypothetical protein [Myxococcota bacterium]